MNLPDGRIYYFRTDPKNRPVVEIHPISVGQMDWKTPIGVTKIVQKEKNPTWYPPKSVRDKHLQDGDVLPPMIPPGPDNPLGEFALRLGIPGGAYLIHGTNNPVGVGMQITHGCICSSALTARRRESRWRRLNKAQKEKRRGVTAALEVKN